MAFLYILIGGVALYLGVTAYTQPYYIQAKRYKKMIKFINKYLTILCKKLVTFKL